MATISGNISKQSHVSGRIQPSIRTTLLRFLAPETEAFSATRGVHVQAFGMETDTDANGFFAISGAFSGSTVVSFTSRDKAFTLPVDVPPGGTLILRDVDLNGDGTARASGTGFRLRGTIDSVSCKPTPRTLAVTLGEKKVKVEIDDTTRIQTTDAKGAKEPCDALEHHVGEQVRIEGDRSKEGALLADRVQIGEAREAPLRVPEVEFAGSVANVECPQRLVVQRSDGQSVEVTLDTRTRYEGALDCDELGNASVRVAGSLERDGRVLARSIEAED